PIHFAVMKGHLTLVKFFLSQGIDVDLFSKGNLAKTPLYVAILYSHYEIVKLLLNYGADPEKLTGFNYNPALLAIHAINSFACYKPYYRYDLQIITKLLKPADNHENYNNLNINILIKPLLKNTDYYIEAANFLLDYHQNISILAVQIIFNYAIQYQILPLAMKCLNIIKQIPSENDIYLRFKKIMLNANLSSMFDGAVIACKHGLKGSNKATIPFEMVNNIIGFSYGNYLSSGKFNIKSSSTDDKLMTNDMVFEKINKRVNTIYSYNF
ncbi:MAG: ankyrin repeat domain-containing protein, partial [Gammaproteobacteria bacterium]